MPSTDPSVMLGRAPAPAGSMTCEASTSTAVTRTVPTIMLILAVAQDAAPPRGFQQGAGRLYVLSLCHPWDGLAMRLRYSWLAVGLLLLAGAPARGEPAAELVAG